MPAKKPTAPPIPLATHETPVVTSTGRRHPFDDAAVGVTGSDAVFLSPPEGDTTRVTIFSLRPDGKPAVRFEVESRPSKDAAWGAFIEHLFTSLLFARKGDRKVAPVTRVFRRDDERVLLILVPFKVADDGGLVAEYRGDRYVVSHYADPYAGGAARVAELLASGYEELHADKPGGAWPKPRLTKELTARGANGSRIDIVMGELVPERVHVVGADGAVVARLRTQALGPRSWAVIVERFQRGVALPILTGEAAVSKGGGITTLWGRHADLAAPDPAPLAP